MNLFRYCGDGLNRPTTWERTKAGDVWFSRSNYQYDKIGREVATWRVRRQSAMTRQWIADRLRMGSASYVSNLLNSVDS
jgi:hypothetical protein